MSVRITVLVENETAADAPSGVGGEHGLSLLVEGADFRVLFDTGASKLVLKNAKVLGLDGAFATLDAVVLSHGHHDHTGGLAGVLARSTGTTPVHIGPGIFVRKVKKSSSGLRDIGVPFRRERLQALGARFMECREPSEERLCVVHSEGTVAPDDFADEQAMAIRTARGIVVLVGCAHRGLLNSIAAAREATGEKRVRAVLGGAHLRSASQEVIDRTAEAVTRLRPDLVALGHCTGGAAEASFGRAFGRAFQPLRAGSSFMLEKSDARVRKTCNMLVQSTENRRP